MAALSHIPVNHSSIQLCRRKSAHGTFVQGPRYSHYQKFCRVCDGIRVIRPLGQELSCLNLVLGSLHSWVLRLP